MKDGRLWNVLYGEYQKALYVALHSYEQQLQVKPSDAGDAKAIVPKTLEQVESEVMKQFKGMLGGRVQTLVRHPQLPSSSHHHRIISSITSTMPAPW